MLEKMLESPFDCPYKVKKNVVFIKRTGESCVNKGKKYPRTTTQHTGTKTQTHTQKAY